MKRIIMIMVGVAAVSILAGCTYPQYSRSVVRTYGPDGKLSSTQVTENVNQMDPNSKPLLNVLETQTFTK